MTYLIVGCNKLRHRMENSCPREFTRPSNSCEGQFLLLLLLRQSALLLRLFFLFHDLPDVTRDRPMIDWYVPFFALFLVKFVMLTNMCTTGRVSSLVESLALPMHFDEVFITPGKVVRTHRRGFLRNNSLANIAPSSYFCLMFISRDFELHSNPIRHYRQEIKR